MRRPRMPVLALAALTLLGATACGGSDPGSGTKTLYVEAQADSDGTTGGTALGVTVRQGDANGQVIDNAVVTVTNADGKQYSLPWVGAFKVGGYATSDIPWSPGWHLQVVSGADRLEATLSAPGATVITSPQAGSTFNRNSGQPLTVAWKDDAGKTAMGVDIHIAGSNYSHSLTNDPGQYAIDPGRLQSGDNQQLIVGRWTEVDLAGGTTGSTFKATTTDHISLSIQ